MLKAILDLFVRGPVSFAVLSCKPHCLHGLGRVPALLTAAALFAAFGCSRADAQQFLNAGTGSLPGYEASGIQSGYFNLKSWFSAGVAYDSNILESSYHPIQDYIFFFEPTVELTNTYGRNTLDLLASDTTAEYTQSGADSFTNLYVRLNDTYFVTPTDMIFGTLSVSDGYQRRISRNFNVPTDAAAPLPEVILFGSAGYKAIGQNVQAGVTVTYSEEQYSNILNNSGGPIDEQGLNERDFYLDSYVNWQVSQHLNSNLAFQWADIRYQDETRNFDQWRLAEALTSYVTSKTSIGVLVAVEEQDTYNVFSRGSQPRLLMEYQAQLEWHPTQLLWFQGIAGYHDLAIDYVQGFFGGGFAQHFSLNGTYLISQRLQFTAGIDYEKYTLSGNNDVDNVTNLRAVIDYELSSYAGISFLVSNQQWLSKDQSSTFTETIVQSSLNLRF